MIALNVLHDVKILFYVEPQTQIASSGWECVWHGRKKYTFSYNPLPELVLCCAVRHYFIASLNASMDTKTGQLGESVEYQCLSVHLGHRLMRQIFHW